MNRAMYTSTHCEWATPQNLFDRLNAIYRFEVDVCASVENHKCARYFSMADDGLSQEWTGHCWMNPPYGREIGRWMKKAYEASQHGALVVCLVPARTDTRWWHDYAMRGEIEFLRGRLRFNDGGRAPFPSAIVVFGGDHE